MPVLFRLMSIPVLLFVASMAFACDGGDEPTPPTATVSPAPAVALTPAAAPETPVLPLDWRDCGDGFECATIALPLDHADPDGATLDVELLRRLADDPDARIGSLLVNPGGPGSPAIEMARLAESFLPDELLEKFDIVGFDPRGAGQSTPVDCGDGFDAYYALDPTPDSAAERQALIDAARAYAADCAGRSGDLLAHVDTESAARDMEYIRAALGEERITYLGYSYGTFMGALYAGLYPQRVRAFVFDGAVDPALEPVELTRTQAIGFENALEAFLAACAGDEGCPFQSEGDPGAAYDALMARIDAEGLPAAGDERRLGPGEATLGVAASLYDEVRGWPALADALAAAAAGDGGALLDLSDGFVERRPDGSYSNLFEANSAINCVDTTVSKDIEVYDALYERLKREAPRLGVSSAYLGLTCVYWPAPPARSPAPIAAAGAPPIVVIGNTGDPATPLVWAESLAAQLDSGVLLTWVGEGHTVFAFDRSDCIDTAVVDYLVRLTVPQDGTICTD